MSSHGLEDIIFLSHRIWDNFSGSWMGLEASRVNEELDH